MSWIEKLVGALDSFRCCKDNDIEIFLRSKAFRFLDCGWCSIYLIVDEQKFDAGTICVEGYFTLSHKSLISDGISKSKVKKVTGGFKEASSMHFVLIGQLGKHIEYTEDGEKKLQRLHQGRFLTMPLK